MSSGDRIERTPLAAESEARPHNLEAASLEAASLEAASLEATSLEATSLAGVSEAPRAVADARPAFRDVFRPGHLSAGLVLPLTVERGDDTRVAEQLGYAQLADRLGFAALWVRDVPLNSPDYPDPQGHFDPWVFLGALTAHTRRIALGTAAIVAPVRHPLHIAKGAVSVDAMSGGRFILGLGSGDRLAEFAAFGRDPEQRDGTFRRAWDRVAAAVSEPSTVIPDASGAAALPFELRPRLAQGAIPMVAIGSSHQTLGWIARNANAWITYYREPLIQRDRFALWQAAVERLGDDAFRGLGQSFQLELVADRLALPSPLPLGMRTGAFALIDELRQLRKIGAHHVLFNLNGTGRPVPEILSELAEDVLPYVND
ncbi:MAG: TIGR03571 family LLM class oxidoreductase [Pseudomonadota bacterium]